MFYQPFPFFVPAPQDYIYTEKSKEYNDFEKTFELLIKSSNEEYNEISKNFKIKYIDNSSKLNLIKYRIDNINL